MITVSMDSNTHSAQVGRLEAVDSGRRRRWSDEEKLKIVLESWAAPRQVSATARRYGGRFLWPSPADGVVAISPAQLGYLLSGIDWRHPQQTWRATSVG